MQVRIFETIFRVFYSVFSRVYWRLFSSRLLWYDHRRARLVRRSHWFYPHCCWPSPQSALSRKARNLGPPSSAKKEKSTSTEPSRTSMNENHCPYSVFVRKNDLNSTRSCFPRFHRSITRRFSIYPLPSCRKPSYCSHPLVTTVTVASLKVLQISNDSFFYISEAGSTLILVTSFVIYIFNFTQRFEVLIMG